jgi:hypothetical protein
MTVWSAKLKAGFCVIHWKLVALNSVTVLLDKYKARTTHKNEAKIKNLLMIKSVNDSVVTTRQCQNGKKYQKTLSQHFLCSIVEVAMKARVENSFIFIRN